MDDSRSTSSYITVTRSDFGNSASTSTTDEALLLQRCAWFGQRHFDYVLAEKAAQDISDPDSLMELETQFGRTTSTFLFHEGLDALRQLGGPTRGLGQGRSVTETFMICVGMLIFQGDEHTRDRVNAIITGEQRHAAETTATPSQMPPSPPASPQASEGESQELEHPETPNMESDGRGQLTVKLKEWCDQHGITFNRTERQISRPEFKSEVKIPGRKPYVGYGTSLKVARGVASGNACAELGI